MTRRMGAVPYGGPPQHLYIGSHNWQEYRAHPFLWTPQNMHWRPSPDADGLLFPANKQITLIVCYWHCATAYSQSDYVVTSLKDFTLNTLISFIGHGMMDEAAHRNNLNTDPTFRAAVLQRDPAVAALLADPDKKITGIDLFWKMQTLKKLSISHQPIDAVCVEFTW